MLGAVGALSSGWSLVIHIGVSTLLLLVAMALDEFARGHSESREPRAVSGSPARRGQEARAGGAVGSRPGEAASDR